MVIKVARIIFGINLDITVSKLGTKVQRLQGKAYNLRNLPLAFGACQAILISIPLVGTGMAIHYLTPRGRVEVAMPFNLGRHLLRLIALVSSQGA